MVQRIGGFRRKTRHKLQKKAREKGKISISKYFQVFKEGAKVKLKADPSIQKGMYFPRYHGKTGEVMGMSGECYKVKILDGRSVKTLVVHPVHLLKA